MMHIFDIYPTEDVKIEDPSLRRYINIDAKLVVKTHGRARERFGKAKVNVIERLVNELSVPGHRAKKHKIMTKATGKFFKQVKVIIKAFGIIKEKTKQNPVQVFVKAIENSAPCDEVTVIEYGGARYPQAVDCSPARRLSLALRNIVHGAYEKSFQKKKKNFEALADEIMQAAEKSNESYAILRRNEAEKQASSAR